MAASVLGAAQRRSFSRSRFVSAGPGRFFFFVRLCIDPINTICQNEAKWNGLCTSSNGERSDLEVNAGLKCANVPRQSP